MSSPNSEPKVQPEALPAFAEAPRGRRASSREPHRSFGDGHAPGTTRTDQTATRGHR
ncbi:hypothetical protein ACGFIW_09525 [Micromonospora sp. NPDC048935]|uniref:hypothetical protein n=1 Tax=Micromonospora sp. NPDC048935 TaxID=3364262 RepID=UPI00371ACE08